MDCRRNGLAAGGDDDPEEKGYPRCAAPLFI